MEIRYGRYGMQSGYFHPSGVCIDGDDVDGGQAPPSAKRDVISCSPLLAGQDQTLPESVPSTTSANIGAKLIHIEGQAPVLVELWDVPYRVYTGGRIFETYLKGTDAVLLVYDVSVEDSWQSALSYYKILTEHLKNTQIQGAPPTVFATIGNKIDLHSSSTDTVTNPNQPPPSQQLTDIASFQVSALEQRHTLSILRTIAQSIATSRPS
ncbi:hypothetical protein Poli38472_003282 [Pythium oligandrum]|uniref:Uncharacterized protein n=1 Tax=Pythium oligandrum TaxID=41045 RepID=A0A8K1C7B5_PYTOL|nr:hypothetical protein Poli38472_003282 [Pythium oligandrum]|eukprot:TMW57357.1 hypothetical protein Poli38472_003282 [Pythium oligandrum]